MWEDPWAQLRKDAVRKQQQKPSSPSKEAGAAPLIVDRSECLADILSGAMQVSPLSTTVYGLPLLDLQRGVTLLAFGLCDWKSRMFSVQELCSKAK